ncbi:MAG: hypothetical protein ACI4RF_03710 [Eubacterium sp.]
MKKFKVILALCLVLLLCFAGGAVYFGVRCAKAGDAEIVKISDTADVTELGEKNTIFQFNEMTIIDAYATYGYSFTDKADEYAYYLVSFYGGDGNMYYASLQCDVKSSIYETINDYVTDTSTMVGDLVLPVCASAEGVDDANIIEYYNEVKELYDKTIELPVTDSGLMLKYLSDTPENAEKSLKEENSINIYLTAGFSAAAVICLAGAVIIGKKLKNTP